MLLYGLWTKNGFTFLNDGENQKNILWYVKIIRNAFLEAHISMFINTTICLYTILSVVAFAAAKAELSSCDYMAYKA